MDDEGRKKLIETLDQDLEAFIQQKIEESKSKHGEGEADMDEDITDINALAEELNNHPAFMKEFDPSKPLSPEMEGLQQLQYEGGTSDCNAESYKEDGNRNFKIKKYRWAIDNYTEGIKCRPESRELNAILYCNRAAANFHLGNFRSSFNDALGARKFKPDHIKAIIRGIQCCLALKRFKDGHKWCDDGLLINPKDEKILEFRAKIMKAQKQQERDKRRAVVNAKHEKLREKRLLQTILDQGIRISSGDTEVDPGSELTLSSVEPDHPSGARVRLDDGGSLNWPVMFMYPEYGQTDFIQTFHEKSRFAEHIEAMFGEGDQSSLPWDEQRKYKPNNLQLCFEEKENNRLHQVDHFATLQSVLKDKRYVVQGGTPAFILLPKDCEFTRDFLTKYTT